MSTLTSDGNRVSSLSRSLCLDRAVNVKATELFEIPLKPGQHYFYTAS